MNNLIVYSIGFLAQILFSARLIFQWIVSEKNNKVITPSLFWKLSLIASILLFIYGYLRQDFAIMLGQSITYFIYIRNLHLQKEWKKTPRLLQWFLLAFPFMVLFYAFNNGIYDFEKFFKNENIPFWLLILGSCAQLIFTFRFIYQWIYSERRKKSIFPLGFWIISLTGAILILSYAFFRKDPVLFIAHICGSFIYCRNIFILKKDLKLKPISSL